ncbi:pilus assembly PilX family protein [Pseudomonas sp. Q1-7]|uniref:pilus assembly PilX family protein n=1 Tax=Pseudomonas sp. Q1-7 TaxID=3020843 RepID=UPI0023014821|nr:PilX N-terminal domain-containing pilus assembly protein [Pseudomonas sp. Q1-7]
MANSTSQRGSSLIIALVFLAVLTAAGIAAFTLATTEERMSSNAQFRGAAFHTSYSEIRAQIEHMRKDATRIDSVRAYDRPRLSPADVKLPEKRQPLANLTARLNSDTVAAGSTSINLTYIGERVAESSSLDKFYNYAFELNVKRELNSGAYSDQVQGFNIQMPKP